MRLILEAKLGDYHLGPVNEVKLKIIFSRASFFRLFRCFLVF